MTESIDPDELNGFLGDDVVYLAGPIRCTENGGEEWRSQAEEWYGDTFDFVNPLDQFNGSQDHVEFVETLDDMDEDSEMTQHLDIEVVAHDKSRILGSDFVFVGLENVITRGTMMEIMYAYSNGVPVYLWLMDGRSRDDISTWVRFHADRISQDMDELMEIMERDDPEDVVMERVNHEIAETVDKQTRLLEKAYDVVSLIEGTLYPVARGEAQELVNTIQELEEDNE